MGRLLSIDYGKKRCGIAVTDPLKIVASSLSTVSDKEVLKYVIDYCKSENVEKIIIGLPLNLSGDVSLLEQDIIKFIKSLKKNLHSDTPIVRVDERFTSLIAKKWIDQSELKKQTRRDKALVDQISATLILQSYMNYNKISL